MSENEKSYYQDAVKTAEKLKDTAGIFSQTEYGNMVKRAWPDIERINALMKSYGFQEAEKKCEEILKWFPMFNLPYHLMIDAIIKQNQLDKAFAENENRYLWLMHNPYHLKTQADINGWVDRDYTETMSDWITSLNKVMLLRDEIQSKIISGYVYRPRKKKG